MNLSTILIICGAIVVGLVILVFSGVGTVFIAVCVWRRFVAWLAQPQVEAERRRSSVRLARQKHAAFEREEAMLRGASVIANELLRTAVQSHLQHLACREDEHRRQDLRTLINLGEGLADQVMPITEGERCVVTSIPSRSDEASATTQLVRRRFWRR